MSSLFDAIGLGEREVSQVKKILEDKYGANVRHWCFFQGLTPLVLALTNDDDEMVKLLVPKYEAEDFKKVLRELN